LTIDILALEPSQRLYAGTLVILEIATDHVRTPGAITIRRSKLGLIEESPSNRAGQGNRPPTATHDAQKSSQVHNILSQLSREGEIENRGWRRYPQWVIATSAQENIKKQRNSDT
jgi:hypothetical protein